MFSTLTCSIEAAVFCNWLQPRAARLETFTFPVDAYLTRDKTCFTRELIAVLPDSLRTLELQAYRMDESYRAAIEQTSQLEAFSHLQPGFQMLQDTVPHLSYLTRLSQLQDLSLPLHAPIERHDLESLGALKSLHTLHLEWRDNVNHHLGQPGRVQAAFLPHASLSVLTALTELSTHGLRHQHLHGLAALSHLEHLTVQRSEMLELTGSSGATSLVSLTLAELTVDESYPSMLNILRSMPLLTALSLSDVFSKHDELYLELKPLLELPSLEHLCVKKCDLDYRMAIDSSRVSRALTRLDICISDLELHPTVPALNQLSCLVRLESMYEQEDTNYTSLHCCISRI